MNTITYLKRLKAYSFNETTLENLTNLQTLHMQNVPFENLDVIRKVPIYLNLQSIYEKIVVNNRGGYCYELNGLFNWLLTQLGYDAKMISATVRRPTGHWAKANTHAAILVRLDKSYLVDVGFGDSTILPIPLCGEEFTDISGAYKIQQYNDNLFDLIQRRYNESKVLYRFSTDSKVLTDFHEGCVFNQVAKESSFTHVDIVTMATPTGRVTITDHLLSLSENGKQHKAELTSDEKKRTLLDTFGIKL